MDLRRAAKHGAFPQIEEANGQTIYINHTTVTAQD